MGFIMSNYGTHDRILKKPVLKNNKPMIVVFKHSSTNIGL